jgi:hypothetical protein
VSRTSPPISTIAAFTRDGGRWGIGHVHRIRTRTTYAGRHEFNKRSKNKALKPASEIVTVEVRRSSTKRHSMPCRRMYALAI